MSWLRLDDQFHRHRKVAPLSDRVWRLHVTAMLECCANETDGKVYRELPATWPSVPRGSALSKAITKLVERGLWKETEDGWIIHDFLDWNISSERARELKNARSRAGKRGGKRSAKAKAKSKQTLKQVLEQNGSKTEANFNPDPDPDPDKNDRPPTPLKVSCPGSLALTDEQVATLSMNTGMTPYQASSITGHLVAKWVGGDKRMPLDAWRRYLSSAVSQELTTGKWPRQPPADEDTDIVADN